MVEKPRPRAIIIDVDYSLRTLMDTMLKDRGYEVHGSSEPYLSSIFLDSKCSCPIGTHCTNVIITDINMPDMTGLEFIEHQKRNGCKVQNIAVMKFVCSKKMDYCQLYVEIWNILMKNRTKHV